MNFSVPSNAYPEQMDSIQVLHQKRDEDIPLDGREPAKIQREYISDAFDENYLTDFGVWHINIDQRFLGDPYCLSVVNARTTFLW